VGTNANSSKPFELKKLKPIGDQKGKLVVLEGLVDVPFEIRRLFYIYQNGPDVFRGRHANRRSQFAFICISGSCKIKLVLSLGQTVTVHLTVREQILLIRNMVWKEMYDFSSDCVLLVVSDCIYDESEYIRSIDEYFKLIGELC
jgi:hypothetical protein